MFAGQFTEECSGVIRHRETMDPGQQAMVSLEQKTWRWYHKALEHRSSTNIGSQLSCKGWIKSGHGEHQNRGKKHRRTYTPKCRTIGEGDGEIEE